MKKVKVIAIPFAGGSQYSYDCFSRFLPPNFTLKTVEFPGRGERLEEKNVEDIASLALDILDQINKEIRQEEYVLYGHSMGTLIGYELTKEIVRNKLPLPSCLFFTGRAGPSISEKDKISSYSKDAFWVEIGKLGGLPVEIRSNNDVLDFLEPVFRADIRAVEDYVYKEMNEPFRIPINVIAGTEEPEITDEKLGAWQKETAFPLVKQFMVGDHFFIYKQTSDLVGRIIGAHHRYHLRQSRPI